MGILDHCLMLDLHIVHCTQDILTQPDPKHCRSYHRSRSLVGLHPWDQVQPVEEHCADEEEYRQRGQRCPQEHVWSRSRRDDPYRVVQPY